MIRNTILIIFLTASSGGFSQEFNYWTNQVGAKSSMLSGAVTAADLDNSSIYYNPGTLGFNQNSSLSLSSDSYYLGWNSIENGAGKGLNPMSLEMNVFPQIIAYNQKVPKIPVTVTLAAVTRNSSVINMGSRNEMSRNLIDELPGNEYYVGTFSYYNRMRDNWIGIGYGECFGEYFGIGGSVFFSIKNMEYQYQQSADVYKNNSDTSKFNLVASSLSGDYFNMKNIGVIFMVGFSYRREKFKIGLNFNMPRINVRFIGRSDLRRSVMFIEQGSDSLSQNYSVWQQEVKSTFKTPFSVDLGLEFSISKSTKLFTKISWFAPVAEYAMIITGGEQTPMSTALTNYDPEFSNIYLANRSVLNAAIAMETKVSEKISVLAGFRTDFNYFDRNAFDLNSDFYPGISYWDIYHFTGGIVWRQDKFDLSLGGSYSLGRDSSLPQIVNLSDPVRENHYFGVPDNSAKARYNQVSIFFGFTYYFPRN